MNRATHLSDDPQLFEAGLVQARDTMELLKKAELEDFFQDECVTRRRLTPSDRDAPRTAILHPILLPDSPVMLLTLPDGMMQVPIPVSSEKVRESARRFRRLLDAELEMPDETRTERSRHYGEQLHDWLIRPVEPKLAARGIDTLIVAPDGILRTIPFSALHDGEHYLARNHAMVIIPSLALTDTGTAGTEKREALLCGLSEGVQEFPPLPHVERELREARSLVADAELLINQPGFFPIHFFSLYTENEQNLIRRNPASFLRQPTIKLQQTSAKPPE